MTPTSNLWINKNPNKVFRFHNKFSLNKYKIKKKTLNTKKIFIVHYMIATHQNKKKIKNTLFYKIYIFSYTYLRNNTCM